MAAAVVPQMPQTLPEQQDPATIVRAGRWLFRHRTITPVPLALAVLLISDGGEQGSTAPLVVGAILVVLGEAIRLWGVRHIGAISRTRSDRLGPLVASGPFALVRNPLYVGNIALWMGFAVSARLLWLVPVLVAILAFEYHAIVRWEERLLEERLGDRYRAYAAQVPRWVPKTFHLGAAPCFSLRETLYSERGTLIAIAIGFALLWLKAHG